MLLPTAPFGLTYHNCDALGYYVSMKTDLLLFDEIFMLSGGIEKELATYANIYGGVGYELLGGDFVLETGFLIKKNKVALGFGLGYIYDESVNFNIGIGFNF